MAGSRVEPWKLDEVERFLRGAFLDASVDHYARGGVANLFVVSRRTSAGRREVVHQLLVKEAFWGRFTDPISLRDALATTDVLTALKRAGDKTVELY